MIPKDLKYTDTHEWIRVEGNTGIIGVTEYGLEKLGDVVYIELPEIGSTVKQGEPFGVIESVKAAVELVSPITGEVKDVNESAKNSPENLINDPYKKGWLIKVEIKDSKELDNLLDSSSYETLTKE
ncbi:MAG: glycine cleavage system protein GcvH [bacterium]